MGMGPWWEEWSPGRESREEGGYHYPVVAAGRGKGVRGVQGREGKGEGKGEGEEDVPGSRAWVWVIRRVTVQHD